MLKLNPMLLNMIDKYLDRKWKYLKVLVQEYNNFDLHLSSHDFYADKLKNTNYTLLRALNFLKTLALLQMVFKKSIYMPWIGSFVIKSKKYNDNYFFPETLLEMQEISDSNKKEMVIHGKFVYDIIKNNKLCFNTLNTIAIQVRKNSDDKNFTWIADTKKKIKYINNKIVEYLNIKNISVDLEKKYKWWEDFEDIVEQYRNNKNPKITHFLEWIEIDDIWFNFKILEDTILLIGYIENNKEKFWLE